MKNNITTITLSVLLLAPLAGLHAAETSAAAPPPKKKTARAAAAAPAEYPKLEYKLPITKGPFDTTDASLSAYKCPDWFRDAKFGIWSHWGPQAVPRRGDRYCARLYTSQYGYHVEHYGHPSEFGYKDIIPLWKAERWDPDALMALYKKVGAKYFVSMGSHHDNFFLWDSKIHRWNSVQMGPHKDVVGLWQKAAKKEGLYFGVSEHLAASYTHFQPSHGADKNGPKAGVPYDGNDPRYQDLYYAKAAPGDTGWTTTNPVWHQLWFDSIKELIDNYHPDLLYSDSGLPFGEVGRSMLAGYYNDNIAKNGGKLDAVYNCKQFTKTGQWVRDFERGVADMIAKDPWQTDTSIGDWYYRTGQKYMTSGEVVRMLIDIVSKNGNLLLNVVQTPEGDLEPDVLAILDGIATWMEINKEGIFSTRPWKVYGEGPMMTVKEKGKTDGITKLQFTAEDFRFTASKDGAVVYAFELAPPTGDVRLVSLAKDGKLADKPVTGVKLLGSDEKLEWKQEAGALVIKKPAKVPNALALTYEIRF